MRPTPLFAVLLLAAACAGPGEEGPDVLDEDAAAALAQGADELAGAFEAGDDCAALAQGDALTGRAREGFEAGLVPDDVLAEVEAVVAETTDGLSCREDTDDGAGADTDDGDDGDDGDGAEVEEDDGDGPGEGRGRGRGGGRDGDRGDRGQDNSQQARGWGR